MIKNIKIVLSIIFITFVSLCLFGCSIINKTDKDYSNEYEIYTYLFSGKSNHFAFYNGMVYFPKNENDIREIVITDFEIINKIKNLNKLKITIYFDNKIWSWMEYDKSKEKVNLKKYIKKLKVAENGKPCEDENICSSDSFMEVSPAKFKNSIKLIADYCTTKNECSKEYFELKFIEDENSGG